MHVTVEPENVHMIEQSHKIRLYPEIILPFLVWQRKYRTTKRDEISFYSLPPFHPRARSETIFGYNGTNLKMLTELREAVAP